MECDVRTRPSHVQGHEGPESGLARRAGGADHASGRARQQHAHRFAGGALGFQDPPARLEDGKPRAPEAFAQTAQVVVHQRYEGCVDDRGRKALVFTVLGQDGGGQADRQLELAQLVGDLLLDLGIGPGMEQAHGEARGGAGTDPTPQFLQLLRARGPHGVEAVPLDLGPDALRDLEAPRARYELLGLLRVQRIDLRPLLASDLDQIGEALVGDQPDLRDAAGQERVERHGRPVDHVILGLDAAERGDAGLDRARGIVGGGGHLGDLDSAAVFEHQVGEGATRVDSEDALAQGGVSVGGIPFPYRPLCGERFGCGGRTLSDRCPNR